MFALAYSYGAPRHGSVKRYAVENVNIAASAVLKTGNLPMNLQKELVVVVQEKEVIEIK